MNTNNILLPFLQKVYSAFKHLEHFSLSNDFFDNISDLDSFFSEYRSSTLVLQKSLGSQDNPIYQKNLNEYILKDKNLSKWMNDKRVDAVHLHPIVLYKHLSVTAYSAISSEIILEKEYTVEFDEPFDIVKTELVDIFPKLNSVEVNFSARYVFTEEDKNVDIVQVMQSAITNMMYFMHAMLKDFDVSEALSLGLANRIVDLSQSIRAKPFSLVRDYYYLVEEQKIESGKILEPNFPLVHIPISKFLGVANKKSKDTYFETFVSLHATIYRKQQGHIMTTFFVKYADDTIIIISFDASLRTTFYRKINEVAMMISNEDVDSVYLVTEFIGYKSVQIGKELDELINTPYSLRRENAKETMLAFFQIDADGISSIMASGELINQLTSTEGVRNWKNRCDATLHNFLTPLIVAFNSKNKKV